MIYQNVKAHFSPKINHDRVANNVFDIQNEFHEDRLSFPVYGEKIISLKIFAELKARNFVPKACLKS
jgi:hypothetical protein